MRRQALPAGHPDIANSLNNLAVLLKAQNKLAEAEPLYREALEIDRQALGDEHLHTQFPRVGLGRLLTKLGQFAEARTLLTEADARLRSAGNVPARLQQRLYDGFVELYEAWHAAEPEQGYDAKAAEWRAKRAEWQASTQPATEP
jgi:tetratricopeptide (TPR) repeat protein